MVKQVKYGISNTFRSTWRPDFNLRTVHYHLLDRSLSPLSPSDCLVNHSILETVYFQMDRPLSTDRPLSPFWTIHFPPTRSRCSHAMNCSYGSLFVLSLSVNCSHGSLFVQCELFARFAVRPVWTVHTVRCSHCSFAVCTVRRHRTVRTVRCSHCSHNLACSHSSLFALFARFRLFALFAVRTVWCEQCERANSEHVCSQFGGPCP